MYYEDYEEETLEELEERAERQELEWTAHRLWYGYLAAREELPGYTESIVHPPVKGSSGELFVWIQGTRPLVEHIVQALEWAHDPWSDLPSQELDEIRHQDAFEATWETWDLELEARASSMKIMGKKKAHRAGFDPDRRKCWRREHSRIRL